METAGSDSGKACRQGSGAPARRKRAAPAPPPPAAVATGPPQSTEAFGDDAEGRMWWTDTWLSAAAARTDDTGSEASVPSILDLPDAGVPESVTEAQPKTGRGARPGTGIGRAANTQTGSGAGARKRRAPAPPPANPAAAPPANPSEGKSLSTPKSAPSEWKTRTSEVVHHDTESRCDSMTEPENHKRDERVLVRVPVNPEEDRRDKRALVKQDARVEEDTSPIPHSAIKRAGETARRTGGTTGSSDSADWRNPLAAGSVTSTPRAQQPPPPAASLADSEYDDLDIDEALFAMDDAVKPQRKRRAPAPPQQKLGETESLTLRGAALSEEKLRENNSTKLHHSAQLQQKPSSSAQPLSLEDKETPLSQGLQTSVPSLQQLEESSPPQQMQCDSSHHPEKSALQARKHTLNDKTSSVSAATVQDTVALEEDPSMESFGMRDADTREEYREAMPEACGKLAGTDAVDQNGLESETSPVVKEEPVRDNAGIRPDLQPVSGVSSSSSALSEPVPPPRPSLSFKSAMVSVSVSESQLDSDLECLEPGAESGSPQKASQPDVSTVTVGRAATPPLPLRLMSGLETPEVDATPNPDLSEPSHSPKAKLSMSKSLSLQLMRSVGEYRAMANDPEPADDAAEIPDSSDVPNHSESGRTADTGSSASQAAAPVDKTADCADPDAYAGASGSSGLEDSDRSSPEADVHCSSMPNISVGRVESPVSSSDPIESLHARASRMVNAGSLDASTRERNNNRKAISREIDNYDGAGGVKDKRYDRNQYRGCSEGANDMNHGSKHESKVTEDNLENVTLLRGHESPSPVFKTPENNYSESTNATAQFAKPKQMLLPSATVQEGKSQNECANAMLTSRERAEPTAASSSRPRDLTPERQRTPPPPRATGRQWTPPKVQLGSWSGYKSSIQLMEDSDYVLHASAQRRSPATDTEAAAGHPSIAPGPGPTETEVEGEGRAHPVRPHSGGDTAGATETRVAEQAHGTATEPPRRSRGRLEDANVACMPWDGGVSERLTSDDFWTRVPAKTQPDVSDVQLGATGPEQKNSDSRETSRANLNARTKPFGTGVNNYVVSAQRRDTGGSDVLQRSAAVPSIGGSERLLIGNGASLGKSEVAPTSQAAQPTAQTSSKPPFRLPPRHIWVNRYQPVVKGFRPVTAPAGPRTANDSSEA